MLLEVEKGLVYLKHQLGYKIDWKVQGFLELDYHLQFGNNLEIVIRKRILSYLKGQDFVENHMIIRQNRQTGWAMWTPFVPEKLRAKTDNL